MWRRIYSNHYCVFNDTLIIRSTLGGKAEYLSPVGRDFDGAVEAVTAHCAVIGEEAIFYGLTDEEADSLLEKYPDSSRHANRDWFDYVYDKTALMTLSGKKYAAQRNHIHKFTALYPDYSLSQYATKIFPSLTHSPRISTSMHSKRAATLPPRSVCASAL